jgi:GntR family transcriptional regulator
MTDYEYERIAAQLGEEIRTGKRKPGSMLPSVKDLTTQFEVSKSTIANVFKLLEERGLARAERGRGTMVLDPHGPDPVRIRITRCAAALEEDLDPWEAACAEQDRAGSVATLTVSDGTAREDVAARLQMPATDHRVIRRYRHARLDGRPAQLQTALYPAFLFADTPFATDHTLPSSYASMRELGLTPATFSEAVSARGALPEEASELRIRPGSPVLVIERITRDEAGTPLELLRIVADPLRTEVLYDELPAR